MHAFVIMGVAGSGKSTIAGAISQQLSCPFLEGDDFHPIENVNKMKSGTPLTDQDRAPWIAAICQSMSQLSTSACIVTCSALNETVRGYFSKHYGGEITYIHLAASKETLVKRMQHRSGHFMPVSLLENQLQALSPPQDGYTINAEQSIEQIVREAVSVISKIMSADK